MNRHYFGTDGVRGPYGGPVINPAFVRRLAAAAGRWVRQSGKANTPGGGRRSALIARDTRASGSVLESAVAAGLVEAGLTPISLGIVPTPAAARAVRRQQAALGVVITASHNPASDNGIKFFGPGGTKLIDAEESQIEQQLDAACEDETAAAAPVLATAAGIAEDYIETAVRLLPDSALTGWRIVLDTANGATCGTSPVALRRLGAEVIGLGNSPDGHNINAGVGSEHPARLSAAVRAAAARLGIAHDGDGDRCVLCDEGGNILDGDEILTLLAVHALQKDTLVKKILVVTEQSNLGVDAAVQAAGGRVLRTSVGDRYVSERMLAEGAMLGGESSGHIICAEVSPAGDGLVAALKVIEVMLATGRPLSELRQMLRKFPQLTAALPVKEKRPLDKLVTVQAAIRAITDELGARGRVLVRYSGTETKIRLLVEGEQAGPLQSYLERLQAAVRTDLVVL